MISAALSELRVARRNSGAKCFVLQRDEFANAGEANLEEYVELLPGVAVVLRGSLHFYQPPAFQSNEVHVHVGNDIFGRRPGG